MIKFGLSSKDETIRELEEANEMLERDLEWERELSRQIKSCRDDLFLEVKRLREQHRVDVNTITTVCEENKRLKRELEERTCFPYGNCCKKDERLTLTDFENEMERISRDNGLDFEINRGNSCVQYRFRNRTKHTPVEWASLVIDIYAFNMSRSDFKEYERKILKDCL